MHLADGADAGARDGPVLVAVQAGRVHVIAGSPRRPALLRIPAGLRVYRNGREVSGSVTIAPGDRVDVELPHPDSAQDGGFTVSVSPDGMAATVRIWPRRAYALRDCPPARVATLELELRELPPAGLTREALLRALEEAGVRCGVLEDGIARALGTARGEVELARGRPPHRGADGEVVALVDTAVAYEPAPPGSGRAGARGRYRVPGVEAGQPVARILPPRPGRDGYDVYGRRLPGTPGTPARVELGEGVRVQEEAGGAAVAVAARDGRPVVARLGDGAWWVDVQPLRVLDGDAGADEGPIRCAGDVVVQGSLREGAEVVAAGNVWIAGHADGATVLAGGDVEVQGGVFRSRVVAGSAVPRYRRLAGSLRAWCGLLRQVAEAEAAVMRAASFRTLDLKRFGPGRLLRLLVEFKFPDLPEQARQLEEELSWAGAEAPDTGGALRSLREALVPLARGQVPDAFSLEGALARAEAALAWVERQARVLHGRFYAGYVHNAQVQAAGDATVGRAGMYYADLEAAGRAEVQGPVVGGRVKAGVLVSVRAAGTPALPLTELQVGEGGRVRIGRAYPQVWVTVGAVRRCIEAPCAGIEVDAGGIRHLPDGA